MRQVVAEKMDNWDSCRWSSQICKLNAM